MSIGYSAIVTIACIAHGRSASVDYSSRDTGANEVLGALSALGAVTFSYGGHSVLLEIQATLRAPPPPKESMMKGVRNDAMTVQGVAECCQRFEPVLLHRKG